MAKNQERLQKISCVRVRDGVMRRVRDEIVTRKTLTFDGECEMVATLLSILQIRPDMWSGLFLYMMLLRMLLYLFS